MTDDAMEDEKPMEDPPPITEQCVATARSTGNRCQNSAIDGGNVCRFHGGATEHVQEAADERLERLARELLAEFEPRINDLLEEYDDADEKVKIHRELRQAVTDVLDRAGKGPTETHEHTGDGGGPVEIEMQETIVKTGWSGDE